METSVFASTVIFIGPRIAMPFTMTPGLKTPVGLGDFDRVVGEADGRGVVADDDGRVRLRVAQGGGDGAHVHSVAGDEVGGGVFAFGGAADRP